MPSTRWPRTATPPSIWTRGVVAGLALLSLVRTCVADTRWFTWQGDDGETVWLQDNRKPALYTDDFGDCLGESSVNVTRFDAAYYKDNMTVVFHLAGETALVSEALMMYIGVYAYGENRFDLTFNPCYANIDSLCPMRENVSIEANGVIPIGPEDVQGIPNIAYSIPDFEGEAILRIFANSTQTEIGCFSAVVTNGNTFRQPEAVGSILGIFTAVAVVTSFATAMYGETVTVMRKHYAHSLSVFVVFAVLQHIYFTGALSMNWPSVLVAFWSNYAWASGMIYSEGMQNSINDFIGANKGNTSAVGAAGVGEANPNLGGGYDISQIYKRRPLKLHMLKRKLAPRDAVNGLEGMQMMKRDLANSSDGFTYYGQPVKPGLPLPGNYSGFAGTLGQEKIPASNAFLTGFLWLLILLLLIVACVILAKWVLEGLIKLKAVRQDRLTYFRSHWLRYTSATALRILFIAFFMMMFLTLFQFTYDGGQGVIAIAAIVFLIFFLGMFGVAGYALYYRLRIGRWVSKPDRLNLERRKVLKVVPWFAFHRESAATEADLQRVYAGSVPFWRIEHLPAETEKSVHEDEDYTSKFGWLASRFRRSRWWFFGAWLVYEFVRACFYAGASGHPMTQVFGLLVVEFIAFVAIVAARPFEGQRLNALVVYALGFSKVATVALSAAFDIRFNLARIPTTAIGVVIIVIQGILTILLLVAIAVGAVTSYWSLARNRDAIRPRKWNPWRERFFAHVDRAAADPPRAQREAFRAEERERRRRERANKNGGGSSIGTGDEKGILASARPRPEGPYFSVNSVRRVAKIEDEDEEFMAEISGLDLPSSHGGTAGAAAADPYGSRTASRTSFPRFQPLSAGGSADDIAAPPAVASPPPPPPPPPGPPSRPPSSSAAAALAGPRAARANSLRSTASLRSSSGNLPFGARVHRASWSSRDFADYADGAAAPAADWGSRRRTGTWSAATEGAGAGAGGAGPGVYLQQLGASRSGESVGRVPSPLAGSGMPERGFASREAGRTSSLKGRQFGQDGEARGGGFEG
ncbi:hypothetical protein BDY21DRAFT_420989 [Lineolata rhizophorae]|uniref:ML-like domain-containing protein n=1 Tax=Lineolata rhizophorae TaxID=578093 RepID=A0A6A6P3P2_9PEZI|nr:hypothetical protein BDY21DRAFT_420989 [Lineolata rhizophorae]